MIVHREMGKNFLGDFWLLNQTKISTKKSKNIDQGISIKDDKNRNEIFIRFLNKRENFSLFSLKVSAQTTTNRQKKSRENELIDIVNVKSFSLKDEDKNEEEEGNFI